MSLTRETVLAALKAIKDPVSGQGQDIVASGVMRALTVDGGTVRFVLEINPSQAPAFEAVKSEAESMLKAMDGVDHPDGAYHAPSPPGPETQSRRATRRTRKDPRCGPHSGHCQR